MNQQIIITVPINEFAENVKCWLREVLTEISNEKDRHQGIPELLTCKQAAKLLNVSLATLHNWHKQGKFAPKKIGRRILYDKQQLVSALRDVNRLNYKNAHTTADTNYKN